MDDCFDLGSWVGGADIAVRDEIGRVGTMLYFGDAGGVERVLRSA